MFRKILIFSIILIMCMGVVSASQDLNDTVTQADDCLNQTTDEIQAADDSDVLQAADDDDELSEEGEFLDVSEAYECLNNFRCEEGVWQWNDDDTTKTYFNTNDTVWLYPIQRDAELEETAKIRAKELYQRFSHTRPDGTLCVSAFPENLTNWGENIAMGQVSCDEVTEDWKETNDPYDGQGHRRNMLDPDFNRVGIAAYKIGGIIYWVQDFGCRYDPKPVENALFYMENNSNSPYFTVQLPVYTTGDFIVRLNGWEVIRKSVVGGKANVTVYGLNSGTYDVELVYGGDSNYMSVSETGTINVLGDSTTSASFTYLNTVIKVGGDEVKLEKDYAFDNATDSDFINGIIIPEPITIDGQGHTIDGKGLSRIFLLYKGSKLKNINLVNASANYGGAILSYRTIVLENCTFENNYASVYGGAAYAVSQLFDDDSRFINNTARFNGGALFGEAAVIVSGSTFIDNQAMNMAGAIYAQGTLSTDNAFYANNTNLQVYSMKMIIGTGNNLEDDYARVFANATVANGVVNLDEDLTSTQTILISANNTVINGNGHTINANGRERIFFITGNNVTIRNITLTGGYGVYEGGAIFCRASDISIIDSTFTDNMAETGAAVSAVGNVFVSSSRFADNTANAGGAIFTDGGNVTVIDSVFENDDAVTFGAGAIYCEAMINVTNSVFMGCDGPSYGVMFTNGKKFGKVYITDSTFINNTAAGNGGVFLAYLGAEISGSVFENNSAGGDGGAIYSWGNVSIVSSNFTGNTAGNNGGVLYHHSGNTSIADSNFMDNSAGLSSGAVYGANIEVMNSSFTDNSAPSSNTFTGKVTGENTTVIENGADVTSAYIAGKASSSVELFVRNVTFPASVVVRAFVENETVVTYVVKTADGRVAVDETVWEDTSSQLRFSLAAGDYVITVNNAETKDINGSSASACFTVAKASSSVDVAVANVTYPAHVFVSVSVVNPIYVSYVVRTTDGNLVVRQTVLDDFSKPLELFLNAGDYVITVSNAGDTNTEASSASANFTVAVLSSSVSVAAANVTYPDNVSVSVSVRNSVYVSYVVKTVDGAVVVRQTSLTDFSNPLKLDLGPGDYVINVTNKGDENIATSSDSAYFSVYKAPSSVSVSAANVTYPGDVSVSVSVENATVVYYDVKTVDGKTVVGETLWTDLSSPLQLDLDAGDYMIAVTNAGDENTAGSSASAYFSVYKASSSVSVSAANATYPGDARVSVSVENATVVSYVVKTLSGRVVVGETLWSDLSKSLELDLAAGNYVITVTNAGDDNIEGSSGLSYFSVYKASSSVDVVAGNATYPGNVSVSVSVENATVVSYVVKTVGGKVVVAETVWSDLSKPVELNLDAGNYIITVTNAGDDNIAESSGSVYFTVAKASSSVSVAADNATYPGSVSVSVCVENGTVVSYVVKTVGGKVVVGETVLSDLSNPLELNLGGGNYIITVTNNEGDNIAGSSASAYFTVAKASSSVNVVAGNATCPESVVVNVSVENATAVTYVVKTVGGNVVVGEKVIDDLSKSLKLNLGAGDYVITVVNEGNDNVSGSSASASFTVFKASGNQSGSGNGTPSGNGTGGGSSSGNQSGTGNGTSGGSSSGSQSGSSSTSGSTTKKVVKKATKITAAKKTFKAKAKTKKYTVTLKSGKKAVSKAKLVLKIKGKTYKATTNKKGKATFKIKLKKKGTFTAKITFAGNKNYKKSSKSVKIKFR